MKDLLTTKQLAHHLKVSPRVATDPSVNGGLKPTPASPPWPPKWGEGPDSGWCKRKKDGALLHWQWEPDGTLRVGRGGCGIGCPSFVPPEELATHCEPL
jgi:hypothetical protein